jgi:hypothetical protein
MVNAAALAATAMNSRMVAITVRLNKAAVTISNGMCVTAAQTNKVNCVTSA